MAYKIISLDNHNEWLKARQKGIGGSDASAVIGRNPYKTNIDLFEEKIGQYVAEDISQKPYILYGTNAEEPIRQLFKLDYPKYLVEHHENCILQGIEYPFLQASLDGELTDEVGRKGILEIKTANILQNMQYEKWNQRIPDNYYVQILHYLLVTGYDFAILRAHLISKCGNEVRTQVKHYFFERSEIKTDLTYLLNEEIKFWRYVEAKKKPPLVLPEI